MGVLALESCGLNSSFLGLKFIWWWGGFIDGDGEDRDRFWNNMDKTLDSVENGYRLCIVGDGTRAGITGAFGVPRENDNGRRVVEFCAERGPCVGNTYFKHISLHKCTRVARDQDGVEIKNDRFGAG